MSKIERILEYINAIRIISGTSTEEDKEEIMFEKEAEEYAENREVCDLLVAISEDLQNYDLGTVARYNIDPLVEECFKDGAGFGYNKAKVEVEDSYRESLCNSELNLASVTEQLEELEKANKWHKVAHGDLPSEEGGWVCNQDGLPCFFDWGTEQWLDCEGTQIRTTEWCHMPHKE